MPTFSFLPNRADMSMRGTEQVRRDVRRSGIGAAALLLAGALAGCATTGDAGATTSQIAPIADSAVTSDTLPPIGAADGSLQVAGADTTTAPGQDAVPPPGASDTSQGADAGATAAASPPAGQGSFVSLNDVGHVAATPGRDLAGGLSVEKLLGGWTVTAGDQQCRLNLTYTSAGTPDRYRASAPACQIQALASVSSWQLSGTQVQLFDDSGAIVGALLLNGNRFVGTLAGGQPVSMVG